MTAGKRRIRCIFVLAIFLFPVAALAEAGSALRQIVIEQTLDTIQVKNYSIPEIIENMHPAREEPSVDAEIKASRRLSTERAQDSPSSEVKDFIFGKDANANIAFGMQTGYIIGHSTYHISFDNPIEIGGHGESELEWPLSNWLMGIDAALNYKGREYALNAPNKASLKVIWLTSLGKDSGKIKDSDWIQNDVGYIDYNDDGVLNNSAAWASNNDGLDIYSEAVARLDKGDILDLNYTYNFFTNPTTGIGMMAGFRYQKFIFSSYSVDQVGYGPYGPAGLFDQSYTDTRGLKWLEYEVDSRIPYLGLSSELSWKDKAAFLFSFGYSDWVRIKDQDTHLYPTTDEALGMNYDMVSNGKSAGRAYLVDTSGHWQLTPAWLLSLGATFVSLDAKGTMEQHLYLNGILVGLSDPIEEKVRSRYWLVRASLKYVF